MVEFDFTRNTDYPYQWTEKNKFHEAEEIQPGGTNTD